MSNTLCYYGQISQPELRHNPFVLTKLSSVPKGRVCVAIDPDDCDAAPQTTSSSAPTSR